MFSQADIIFLNGQIKDGAMYALYDTFKKKYISYDPVNDVYKHANSISCLNIWDYHYLDHILLYERPRETIVIKEIPTDKIK